MQYIIRPSHSQSCADRFSRAAACVDNELTLSQFVNNSSHYLTNDTTLIFSPGNYSLKSEFIVENVHSFSMSAWSASSSSKAVSMITCGHNARFEFRNISTVAVSGFEFIGCFENYVVSVGQFQLENSAFFGYSQALPIVHDAVLNIDKSTVNLDRIMFISTVAAPLQLENGTLVADNINLTTKRLNGILSKSSNISITHSRFEGNVVQFGAIIDVELGSRITVDHTTFLNNIASSLSDCNITGSIVYAHGDGNTINMNNCKFVENIGVMIFGDDGSTPVNPHTISHKFSNNRCSRGRFINLANTISNKTGGFSDSHTKITISKSDFIGNSGSFAVYILGRVITDVDCSEFINNTDIWLLFTENASKVSITGSEFVNNSASDSMIEVDAVTTSIQLTKFIDNRTGFALIEILYFMTAESLTNNVFIDNNAVYEIVIYTLCRPGLFPSLGSSRSRTRCIQCSENWRRYLIGIVIAAFLAGILLVIFMLALNMTVAVGTLNGILFYANIVTANAVTKTTPKFVTIFISWLNLDIGFDVCFFSSEGITFSDLALPGVYKALLQLAFPVYVIILLIIVIVASECSSKFTKIISKGNPVAVLATLILLSYAKFLNGIHASFLLLYYQPAHGSRNLDITRLGSVLTQDEQSSDYDLRAFGYFLLVFCGVIFSLCIIFAALVFSWQWLVRYEDKAIFKWVRYQKLCLFLEPYHAPYVAKYRYWTGLLLIVRLLLDVIVFLNFSLDPRVNLMSIIFIVGGLILLKGVIARRIYKNWPLDVMETVIYFNLVGFSALTWYNLDFGGNQAAVAYTSVMIIFVLLMGVIVFHVFRYTRLYELSFVENAFKWTNSKLLEKMPKEQPPNDDPEELDGYQLERSAAGDQELPTITYSVIEINQPARSQQKSNEEKHTDF